MSAIIRGLQGVSSDLQLGVNGHRLLVDGGAFKVVDKDGNLVPLKTAASSNASHTVLKSELDAAVSALVDGAPGALDTLNELAAAFGDDANFATTVTNALAVHTQDITDSVTLSGLAANATSYGATLAGGVVSANATTKSAIKEISDAVKTLNDNVGGETVTALGDSVDAGKIRTVTITADGSPDAGSLGDAFASGNFIDRVVVKVKTPFDSDVGDLVLPALGTISAEDLEGATANDTFTIASGVKIGETLTGAFQAAYALAGTASAGVLVVSIIPVSV